MQPISQRADTALDNLNQLLRTYASGRQKGLCVGQFLDGEGLASSQRGVYGMGAWVAIAELANGGIRYEPAIQRLTLECKDEIARLINAAHNPSTTEEKALILKRLVPKLCYAYIGISTDGNYQSEVNLISQWIAAAQCPGSSWGYLTTASAGSPEMTAVVVRHFVKEPSLSVNIQGALAYLRTAFQTVSNAYLRLYVLNTIVICGTLKDSANCHKPIKETIGVLLNQAFFNPTRFANPINIDFNDESGKTHYIRLPTNTILLEALELISGPRKLYVRGHPGRRVLNHLFEVLSTAPQRDTTDHRISPFSVLYYRRCLVSLKDTQQSYGIWGLIESAWAYLMCAWAFGVNIGWNAISVVITLVGVTIAHQYASTFWTSAFLGALVKSVLDTGKSFYNSFYRFARD